VTFLWKHIFKTIKLKGINENNFNVLGTRI